MELEKLPALDERKGIQTIVLQFNSERTPGELYNISLSTIEELVDVTVNMVDEDALHELRLRLSNWLAEIENRQSQIALNSARTKHK